jgi:hypothetical protein
VDHCFGFACVLCSVPHIPSFQKIVSIIPPSIISYSFVCICICVTGDTRGGALSVKKHEHCEEDDDDGLGRRARAEVIFSYTDRVAELCAQDFFNIILNFVETAVSLRRKLLATSSAAAVVQVQVQQQQQPQLAAATTNHVLFASSSSSSSSSSTSSTTCKNDG